MGDLASGSVVERDGRSSDRKSDAFGIGFALRAQLLGVMGNLPIAFFPVWWGALIAERHYDLTSIGKLQLAQMIGFVGASFYLLLSLSRINLPRTAAISLLGMAVCYTAPAFVTNVGYLAVIFGIQCSCASICIVLGTVFLGQTASPERQYSLQMGLTACLQMLAGAYPLVVSLLGAISSELLLALPMVICARSALGLPLHGSGRTENGPTVPLSKVRVPRATWAAACPAVVATVLFSGYAYNISYYSERVATARNISLESYGGILALAAMSGLFGALCGVILGNRWGRAVPLAIASMLGGVAIILLLAKSTGHPGMAIGMLLFSATCSMGFAYTYAQLMAVETSGRMLITMGPFLSTGGVLVSAITLAMSTAYDLRGVLYFTMALLLFCGPLMILSNVLLKRAGSSQVM